MTFAGAAGVIGWPVGHSKSPLIHRFWLAALGLDGDYSRFAVPPERLGEAVRALGALGLAGVNVTVPHKVAALALADAADASAASVGAANILLMDGGWLRASNSDVAGVLAAGLPRGGRALLLGAGGAARAALAACREAGVGRVTLAARDPARAAAVAGMFGAAVVPIHEADPRGADMLVNATPMGMRGAAAAPPALLDALAAMPAGAAVFDMVYAPLETPLLIAARAAGLRTVDGLTMLIAQAAAAFALFYGRAAPRGRDAELRALLTA